MFEHSIRVPRHYKVAANIFKKVSTEGGSVKTLLYDNKLRHFRTNVLFALITETVKHATDIDNIFEACEILKNETRLDPWLAKVLTAELLFGKKALPGGSKPEQTILAYREKFQKYTNEHEADLKTEVVHRPRYVRVNTNLLTTSDAIRHFQDEGYRFIRCTASSYDDYLVQIKGLTNYDFTQDYHVKTVFVFPHGTKFHEHELYLENQIILQDKATAMAVHLLAPSPGGVVLDMCAAPGMKTTQVAAYMRNEGKVYAVERNEKRFETLKDFVNKTECKCVEPILKDALEIKRGDYDDVEYILLDPSCSGSGMEFTVHNYIEDTRLAKLTSLQEKFLKHAMNAFPKAKRIVYSTCSLFPEENERVITNVVRNSRAKWRVQDVKEMLKGQWNNFGSGMYGSIGTRCLYARPNSDLTTGFFLAVLDRDAADLEKHINSDAHIVTDEINSDKAINQDNTPKQKRKKKEECLENNASQTDDNVESLNAKKKKEKRHLKTSVEVPDHALQTDDNEENLIANKKSNKEKKKRGREAPENVDTALQMDDSEDHFAEKKKKKEKKQKTSEISDSENNASHIDRDHVENVCKKKKKNKEIKIKDSETSDNHGDTSLCSNGGTQVSKDRKAKKENKKRKHNVVSESTIDNDNAAHVVKTTEAAKEKSKKKKQKCEHNL